MIKLFIQKIMDNEFYKNIFTLFGGLIIAQVIPLLIVPVLTRIYSVEIFGIFFIYSAIVVILSIFATLQYEITIVLPEEDSDAINLLILSLSTSLIISILLFIIIFFFNRQIALLLGDSNIGPWLFLIPVSIFFTGIFQSFSYFGNRFKKYKTISGGRIVKSTITGLSQLSCGITGYEKFGLIGGLIFGQIISAAYMAVKFFKKVFIFLHQVSVKRMIRLIKIYKNVPTYNTLMGLQNRLSGYLPFFLLGNYYGVTIVSLYGLAHRIIGTPTGIVSQSIGQVFYQKASESYNNKDDLYGLVKGLYIKLLKVAIIPFTLLFFIAPAAFKFIFGPEWISTGRIIQILTPWLLLSFLNTPITSVITILNKQKVLFIYNTLLLIFRFFALFIGFKVYNNEYYSIAFYALIGFIFNSFILFYMLAICRNPYGKET
ncbi:MAG: oligosaccharide flippase family protein [Calditrichaceae bacterium]|jgi:lipopolysaccharide exporter